MKKPSLSFQKKTGVFPVLFLTSILFISGCTKEDEMPLTPGEENMQTSVKAEEAYPGYEGEIVTINYLHQELQVVKHGNEFILDGDIIIDPKTIDDYNKAFDNLKAQYANRNIPGDIQAVALEAAQSKRWNNARIPYTIDPNLPRKNRVTDAIAHWEARTKLRFTQRTNQNDYIEFTDNGGCSSYIGKRGGRQTISVGSGCTTGNTIHEIGHAIGFFHEQTRKDRDNHVIIHENNIESGKVHNFHKYTTRTSTGADVGNFDFGSIMMYGPYFFSANGQPTITRRDGSTYSYQRNGLSSGDIAGANYLYP
ncbi:M12 family metallopeptidase [Sinomicrobium sp. M5D2P17]